MLDQIKTRAKCLLQGRCSFLYSSMDRFVFKSVFLLHVIIYFTVATDNNGDPNEYLEVSRTIFSNSWSVNVLRFFGYPLFINITSLGLTTVNLTFLAQHAIFLFALRFFAIKITSIPLLRALIYLPALIPAVGYLPNLLFPDSLILSFLLFFSACLYVRNYRLMIFFGCCLILIKLVFVFLMILVVGLYFSDGKKNNKIFILIIMSGALLSLVPIIYITFPFALYQSVVQKPIFLNDHVASSAIPAPFDFTCGGEARVITDPTIIAAFEEHRSDINYLPLSPAAVHKLECTSADIKSIQRRLVVLIFLQAPWQHLNKLVGRWVRNVFVFSDHAHIGYMLSVKYQLLKSYYSFSQYYEPTQLESFKSQRMSPIRLPNQTFLGVLNSLNQSYQHLISIFIVICAGLGAMSLILLKNLRLSVITPLLLVISFYSFCIAVFAFGYDRYIFINYFLWMGVIAVGFRQIVGALSVNADKT